MRSTMVVACSSSLRRSPAASRAPEIVLVDRATALEQQAAGSYGEWRRSWRARPWRRARRR